MVPLHNMKRYTKIGELLRDIRGEESQASMAARLDVNVRTYRRCEAHNKKVSADNLDTIAEKLMVPFEVLLRLNYDFPTLYNPSTRRYALCPFNTDYVSTDVLRTQLEDTDETGKITSLINNHRFQTTKKIEFPVYYPYGNRRMDEELIYKAAVKLPDLNIIIEDPNGYYSGHLLTIPLNISSWNKIKEKKMEEHELKTEDIADVSSHAPIALHILSMFATNSTYVYCLAKRLIRVLISKVPSKINEKSIITRYAVTLDGAEFGRKFGMIVVDYDHDAHSKYKTETAPHILEIPICEIEWLNNYKIRIIKR